MYSDANDNVIFISSEYIAILPLLAHRLDVWYWASLFV